MLQVRRYQKYAPNRLHMSLALSSRKRYYQFKEVSFFYAESLFSKIVIHFSWSQNGAQCLYIIIECRHFLSH